MSGRRSSCDGCRYYLGGGCCRMNVEGECREGGGFELWEAKRMHKETPFEQCRSCVCSLPGQQTIGCAATRLAESAKALARSVSRTAERVFPPAASCEHYEKSVYAMREEKRATLARLTGPMLAEKIAGEIDCTANIFGLDVELGLWDRAIELALEGAEEAVILALVRWQVFRIAVPGE